MECRGIPNDPALVCQSSRADTSDSAEDLEKEGYGQYRKLFEKKL